MLSSEHDLLVIATSLVSCQYFQCCDYRVLCCDIQDGLKSDQEGDISNEQTEESSVVHYQFTFKVLTEQTKFCTVLART